MTECSLNALLPVLHHTGPTADGNQSFVMYLKNKVKWRALPLRIQYQVMISLESVTINIHRNYEQEVKLYRVWKTFIMLFFLFIDFYFFFS